MSAAFHILVHGRPFKFHTTTRVEVSHHRDSFYWVLLGGSATPPHGHPPVHGVLCTRFPRSPEELPCPGQVLSPRGGRRSGRGVRGDAYPRGWSTHQGATAERVTPRLMAGCSRSGSDEPSLPPGAFSSREYLYVRQIYYPNIEKPGFTPSSFPPPSYATPSS